MQWSSRLEPEFRAAVTERAGVAALQGDDAADASGFACAVLRFRELLRASQTSITNPPLLPFLLIARNPSTSRAVLPPHTQIGRAHV